MKASVIKERSVDEWRSTTVEIHIQGPVGTLGLMTTIDDEESRKKIDIGIPRNLSLGILGIPSMFTRKELFRKNKFFL